MFAVELDNHGVQLNTLIINPEAPKTIVMLHGMFGNLSQFYLTLVPHLSKEYRVVLYDFKSHGKSSRHKSGYTIKSFTEELVCLLDKLKIEKCHFVGFSFGALVVLKMAMLYKERVEKVIAIEIPPRPLYVYDRRDKYTFDDFMRFADNLPLNVKENFFRSKRQVKNTYEMYEYIINQTSFLDDVNNESEFDYSDYYSIDAPVQLLFGRKSVGCLPELFRVNEWIKRREIRIIDGDHGFFMQNPKETALVINKFLIKSIDEPNNDINDFKLG